MFIGENIREEEQKNEEAQEEEFLEEIQFSLVCSLKVIDSRAKHTRVVVVVVAEGKSRPVGKKGGMTSAHDSRRVGENGEGIECIKIINYKIHGGKTRVEKYEGKIE